MAAMLKTSLGVTAFLQREKDHEKKKISVASSNLQEDGNGQAVGLYTFVVIEVRTHTLWR